MKTLVLRLCSAALLLTACAVISDGDAPSGPRKHYTIEELMDNAGISGASFSSEETTLLVSSDETGIVNAQRIDRQSTARAPIARSTNESTFAVSFFPHDNQQFDVVGVRRDQWIDMGEGKCGSVKSLPIAASTLESKISKDPLSSNFSIGKHIFLRSPSAHHIPGIKAHHLADLFG